MVHFCPKCSGDTKVLETRSLKDALRRRRECLRCQHRYTTYETRTKEPDLAVLILELENLSYDHNKLQKRINHLLSLVSPFFPKTPLISDCCTENNSGIEL